MTPRQPQSGRARFWRRHRPADAALGAVLTLMGSLAVSFVAFVSFGDSAFCRSLAITLGLALPLVIAGLGQAMVLMGVALLWRAAAGRGA